LLQKSRTDPALRKQLMDKPDVRVLRQWYGDIPSLNAARKAFEAKDEDGNQIVKTPPRTRIN